MGLFKSKGDTGERGPKGHVGAHRMGGTGKGTFLRREDRDADGKLMGFAVEAERRDGRMRPADSNYERNS